MSDRKAGPPPPFDPDLARELPRIAAIMAPDGLTMETIGRLRADEGLISRPSDVELGRDGAFTVRHLTIPGPTAAPDLSLLVCRPTMGDPTAIVYHIHGGGMVAGDHRNGMLEMLDWAQELSLVVVSVDYRLAPECPHPGPVEDCHAGLLWTINHAPSFGVAPTRVLVAGASAGGGLAAGAALIARDRASCTPLGLVLMAPMLDDRNNSVSAIQMTGLGVWDRRSNATAWTALLGKASGSEDVSAYAAPARAVDLSGLPPMFLDVGSAETFRDEVVTWASNVWAAGGRAELHVWPGGFHGFTSYAQRSSVSHAALTARRDWVRRLVS